jgi:hypothetical protein
MTDHFVEVHKKVLSPSAQAVLDAYENTYIDSGLVAAIFELADQLDHAASAHTLYAIAIELEGQ